MNPTDRGSRRSHHDDENSEQNLLYRGITILDYESVEIESAEIEIEEERVDVVSFENPIVSHLVETNNLNNVNGGKDEEISIINDINENNATINTTV